MEIKFNIKSTLTSLLLVAIILLGTTTASKQISAAKFYQQSKIIGLIVSQDSVSIASIVGDRENIDLVGKFAQAITSAYINFELIPVNEANTFAAVFESLTREITVERFEYKRKTLIIHGNAATPESYIVFLQRLIQHEYFQSVYGHYYTATDDSIRFEIECNPAEAKRNSLLLQN